MRKFKNQEHSFLLKSPRNRTMFSKMQKYALGGRLRILLTALADFLNPFLLSFSSFLCWFWIPYKSYWWIMFILEKDELFNKYMLSSKHNGNCLLVCLFIWSHQSEWPPKWIIECLCVVSSLFIVHCFSRKYINLCVGWLVFSCNSGYQYTIFLMSHPLDTLLWAFHL